MRQAVILLSLVFVPAMFMSGCASDRLGAKMASWQGSHIDSVTSRWGPADRCEEENGQMICTWTDDSGVIENASSSFPLAKVNRPGCTRTLAIDPSGQVTGWRWRGDGCELSGQNVMAKNDTVRPSAVAVESDVTKQRATTAAGKQAD